MLYFLIGTTYRALPLGPAHKELLCESLKVRAVLSILEDFELASATLVGLPVKPQEWKRLDIDHLQLRSTDFFSPSFVSISTTEMKIMIFTSLIGTAEFVSW